MVLVRQFDAGRHRRIGFRNDAHLRQEALEPSPLVGGRQIPASLLGGVGGGDQLRSELRHVVAQWVAKAEEDLTAAEYLLMMG